MRRVLKLAALLGGFSALAWSLRNRIRIAIHRGSAPDSQSETLTEVVYEAAGDEATVSASAPEEKETETDVVEETGEEGEDSPSDDSVNPN